ncbi:molybdenum cofactor guanylyltransferase MobA [Sulfurimonas sp.]
MFNIPCVIFAGGKSSRMGEDKALLPFANFTTLTEYQYNRLSKIFKNVYISCKEKSKFDFEAHFIEDNSAFDIFAPTIGFYTAFASLKIDKFFALSVDTPFVTEKEIAQLINIDNINYDATIAKTVKGIQPLCGIYHHSLSPSFKMMLEENNHKLGFLLKNSNTKYVYFSQTQPFLNLNHPHEYKEALNIISHY